MALPPEPYVVRRRLRNFLLDRHLQLRFTLYALGGVALLAGGFALCLLRADGAQLRETEAALEARSRAAEASRLLSAATLNNELLARLDDPAFAAQLGERSAAIDRTYEAEQAAVLTQRVELLRRQRATWLLLAACMGGVLALVALATIVATHRIVGPVYRMRRLLEQVADGQLPLPPHRLRAGDELQDVFAATAHALHTLRERQLGDVAALSAALERAERAGLPPAALGELRALEEQMRARVAGASPLSARDSERSGSRLAAG